MQKPSSRCVNVTAHNIMACASSITSAQTSSISQVLSMSPSWARFVLVVYFIEDGVLIYSRRIRRTSLTMDLHPIYRLGPLLQRHQ